MTGRRSRQSPVRPASPMVGLHMAEIFSSFFFIVFASFAFGLYP
jgi:hypothetical protein